MDNQLQHKLLHYEVAPPPKVWGAISEALDDQGSTLAERLYHLEQRPNNRAWEQIDKELDTEVEEYSKVLPLHKRYHLTLKYGSAVAVLIVAAVLITLLINRKEPINEVVQGTGERPAVSQPTQSNREPGNKTNTYIAQNDQGQEASKGATEQEPAASAAEQPDRALAARSHTRINPNRYMTVAREEGTPVRLSKKVYPVFDCAEKSTAIKRYRCKENIEAMQQKMASTLASPAGDFASLMDMIKTLEENR